MSLVDDIKRKAEEAAKNPDLKDKAKEFADKHKDTIEEAKNKLLKKDK